jgi:hypothetical protein
MPDYRNLTGSIRAVLARDNQVLTDAIRQLAHQYADACNYANQRLLRCQEFLSRGLLTEAIQYADVPPNILELVAILEMPQRRQWDELTARYGLPAAEPLQQHIVRALNQSYAEYKSLGNTLREHRRLALIRGPLFERLELMRVISRADRHGPWAEDIATFEQARLAEIDAETKAAHAAQDRSAVEELARELKDTRWLVPLPHNLLVTVSSARQDLASQDLGKGLATLEGLLRQAFTDKDAPRARQLRARWHRVVADADLALHGDIMLRAAPILAWLAERDRQEALNKAYREAVQTLANAVAYADRLADLHAAYQAVARFGRGVPAGLRQRYEQRLYDLKCANRRRRWALTAWMTGAAAALILIGWLFAYRAARERRYQALVTEANDYLERGALEEAISFFDELAAHDRGMLDREQLSELFRRHRAEREREAARAEAFQRTLERVKTTPVEEGQPSDFDEARRLARSSEEKNLLAGLERLRQTQTEELKRKQFTGLRKRAQELDDQLTVLHAAPGAPDAERKLRAINGQIEELAQEAAKFGAEGDKIITELKDDLAKSRGQLNEYRLERTLSLRMIAAFGGAPDLKAYCQALGEYARSLHDRARARDFNEALKQKRHWFAVSAWRDLAWPWSATPLPDDWTEGRKRRDQCREFLKAYPDCLHANDIGQFATALDGDPDKASQNLAMFFQNPVIRDAVLVTTKRGERYYLPAEWKDKAQAAPEKKDPTLMVKYYEDYEGNQQFKIIQVAKAGPAPQCQIASEWAHLFKDRTLGPTQWEQAVLRLATVVSCDAEVDPILKLEMLRLLLDAGAMGSPLLGQALEKQRTFLDKQGAAVGVRWMDPTSKPASAARPKAEKALEDFPALKDVADRLRECREHYTDILRKTLYTPVGWLSRTEEGAWKCNAISVAPKVRVVSVLVERANGGTMVLQDIGKREGETFVLQPPVGIALHEGQVLFGR